MFIVVFLSVVGLACGQVVNLPHGHDLKVLIDGAFNRIDHSPRDGVVLEMEFDYIVEHDDANNDSCVTLDEYKAGRAQMSAAIAEPLYKHLAALAGNAQCITMDDLKSEFHLIDKNNDGQATMHEFEQYFSHLLGQVFGHAHNG